MADLFGSGGMAEDFQEEEVWAMMNVRSDGSHSKARKSSSSAWRFAATSRAIPRSSSSAGGGGSQRSAPINIPDWSKILRKNSGKKLWDDASDAGNDEDGCGRKNYDVDDDNNDDDMLPPHEYLARRLASTQIASFSMCEGVGRTLKGRDLSNLRNAILTKTGFLE